MHTPNFSPYPDGFSFNKHIEDIYNSIDEEIKTIEVDSLRKVNLFYRDVNTLIMRCYIDDSCRYIQLISKRKNDVLLVKHKKNWINIDSVGHYYCFFPLA